MTTLSQHKLRYSIFVSAMLKKIRPTEWADQLVDGCLCLQDWLEQQLKRSNTSQHCKVEQFRHTLRYPFGKKSVIGLLAILSKTEDHEVFRERHFTAAILNVYPQAQPIDRSFLSFEFPDSPYHLVYIEVTAPNEEGETYVEEQIQISIVDHVERVIPVPFSRPNQEELFHKLSLLNREITGACDLPQVTASYQEHNQQEILFSVVVVRVISGPKTSLENQLHSGETFTFLPSRCEIIGKLDEGVYKEGNLFHLRIPSAPFLRKDFSIDLYKARRYVTELLEGAIGPFRDFNGGLLQKQSETLEALRQSLGDLGKSDDFLLENFFFSFTPVTTQSTLPIEPLKRLYLAFLEARGSAPSRLTFQHQKWPGPYHLELLYAGDEELQRELERTASHFNPQDDTSAFTHFKVDGILYFGWISFSSQGGQGAFDKAIEEAIRNLAEKRKRHKQLRIGLKCTHPSLDPRITRNDDSSAVVKLLYEGLTRIGRQGKPEPAMANSIAVSADGLVYTFFLREAYWSNGDPVTAHDFEQGWKKAIQAGIHSLHNYVFFCIHNAKRASLGETTLDSVGIEPVNKTTLRVTLAYPTPSFTEMTAHWTYLPTYRGADQQDPAWAEGVVLVCNGPFTLEDWRPRIQLGLVKNPAYWDADNVAIDAVTAKMVRDVNEEVALFHLGHLDLVRGVAPQPFEIGPTEEIVEYDASGTYSLFFNTEHPLFSNKTLRQALAAAIDWEAIDFPSGSGKGKAGHSLLPPKLSLVPPPFYGDPREYLSQACDELGVTHLPTLEVCYAYHPGRKKVLEAVQQQWKAVLGIDSRLISMEWTDFSLCVHQGDFQVSAMFWRPWFSDPLTVLQCFIHYPSFSNPARWRNQAYIDAVEQACAQLQFKHRRSWMERAERILVEEVPVLPLHTVQGSYPKARRLTGVQVGPVDEFDLKWCKIKDLK